VVAPLALQFEEVQTTITLALNALAGLTNE
jgi:hypothetical protein